MAFGSNISNNVKIIGVGLTIIGGLAIAGGFYSSLGGGSQTPDYNPGPTLDAVVEKIPTPFPTYTLVPTYTPIPTNTPIPTPETPDTPLPSPSPPSPKPPTRTPKPPKPTQYEPLPPEPPTPEPLPTPYVPPPEPDTPTPKPSPTPYPTDTPEPSPTPEPPPTATPTAVPTLTPTPTATPVPLEAKLGFVIEKVESIYKKFRQYIHNLRGTITETGGADVELINVQLCYEQPIRNITELMCQDLDDILIKGNDVHPFDIKFETTDPIKEAILKYSRLNTQGMQIDEKFIINFLKESNNGDDGDNGENGGGDSPGGGD